MSNEQIINCLRTLVADECPNYRDGHCLLNGRPCGVKHGGIDCKYFNDQLIPADWDCNTVIAYAEWYGASENQTQK